MDKKQNNTALGGGTRAARIQPKQHRQFTATHEFQKHKTQPGTALAAYLKRYRLDLLSQPFDRHISQLVDCCDCLLDEVARQENQAVTQ